MSESEPPSADEAGTAVPDEAGTAAPTEAPTVDDGGPSPATEPTAAGGPPKPWMLALGNLLFAGLLLALAPQSGLWTTYVVAGVAAASAVALWLGKGPAAWVASQPLFLLGLLYLLWGLEGGLWVRAVSGAGLCVISGTMALRPWSKRRG